MYQTIRINRNPYVHTIEVDCVQDIKSVFNESFETFRAEGFTDTEIIEFLTTLEIQYLSLDPNDKDENEVYNFDTEQYINFEIL